MVERNTLYIENTVMSNVWLIKWLNNRKMYVFFLSNAVILICGNYREHNW
uniref:Uncharacterized protein n=1 Tax=Anguilla anguilla TaxID=7936 RepID=A0A0E9PSE6_ANGAN